MSILNSDVLFTTEEPSDDEREANREGQGYGDTENPFLKKKAPRGTKRADRGGSLISAGTLAPSRRLNPNIVEGRNKLFGPFDMGKIVGEDEILLKSDNAQFSESDLKQGLMLAPEDKREARKKEIDWQTQANGQLGTSKMDEEFQNSASKHEAKERERKQQKLFGMMLSQSILTHNTQEEELELVIEGETTHGNGFFTPNEKSSMIPEGASSNAGPALTKLSSGLTQSLFLGGASQQNPLTSTLGSSAPLLASTAPGLFTASGAVPSLKRANPPLLEASPLKDREDLFRALKKTTRLMRPETLTAEDQRRMGEISELPDQTELVQAKQDKQRLKEDQKSAARKKKEEIAKLVALEEGTLSQAGEGNASPGKLSELEGRSSKQSGERASAARGSEDSEADEDFEAAGEEEQSQQTGSGQDDGDLSDSNEFEDEAEEVDDDDALNEDVDAQLRNRREDQQEQAAEVADDGEEAEESMGGEDPQTEKKFSRLRRKKDVLEAKRRQKEEERAKRTLKYLERRKEEKALRKQNRDYYDEEADLGEVVDGKDAGIKEIDVAFL